MIPRQFASKLISASVADERINRSIGDSSHINSEGLLLSYDAQNPHCYPSTGLPVTDLSSAGNSGTLESDIGFDFGSQGGWSFPILTTSLGVRVSSASAELLALQDPLTILMAVKWTTAPASGYAAVFSQYTELSAHRLIKLILLSATTLRYYSSKADGTYQGFDTGLPTPKNTWIILAITVSEGSLNAFVNGVYSGSPIVMSALSATPSAAVPVYLGRNSRAQNEADMRQNFRGNIDICRVWNRALTQTELLQHYNALRGRYGL